MPTRGVIYLVWGNSPKVQKVLQRSIDSLAITNPGLPHTVAELTDEGPWKTMLQKATMLDRSPYDETVFLDADTLVLGNLDLGFDKARQHGLACCINEAPWMRRYDPQYGDMIEYNTGVVFFSRKAAPFFEVWKQIAPDLPSQHLLINSDGELVKMPYADQTSFSLAVEKSGINPFVLPLNWNYRPPWHYGFVGPLRVWHSYLEPPANVITIAQFYNKAKNPVIQYHLPDMPLVKPPEPKVDNQRGVKKG